MNFSSPYCRESKVQNPTSRVVRIPKYAPEWKTDKTEITAIKFYDKIIEIKFLTLASKQTINHTKTSDEPINY